MTGVEGHDLGDVGGDASDAANGFSEDPSAFRPRRLRRARTVTFGEGVSNSQFASCEAARCNKGVVAVRGWRFSGPVSSGALSAAFSCKDRDSGLLVAASLGLGQVSSRGVSAIPAARGSVESSKEIAATA